MISEEEPEEVLRQLLCDGEGKYDFSSHFTNQIFFFCLQGGKFPLSSPLLHCSPSLIHTEEMCEAKGKGSGLGVWEGREMGGPFSASGDSDTSHVNSQVR